MINTEQQKNDNSNTSWLINKVISHIPLITGVYG